MSGFPDINVEYESTEPGIFSEDMTLARGSDRGRRTYNLSCTFRDVQGGYIMGMFLYWLHLMALQMEGIIVAYPEDRDANRLNYTCSIYRFIMDSSQRQILKWAKATGCYPVSIPIGDVFNFGPGDSFIHTSQQFTVPFVVNNMSYMDPIHLKSFNDLVMRYSGNAISSQKTLAASADQNFLGTPLIDLSGNNELMWKAAAADIVDPSADVISNFEKIIASNARSGIEDLYITPKATA
jgi:hypothetical protein